MLRKVLTLLFIVVSYYAKAQDDMPDIPPPGKIKFKIDTNKLVDDINGKPLQYYQYNRLVATGEFALKFGGNPNLPESKGYLVKTNIETAKGIYEANKAKYAISSPLLKEGGKLDLTPLTGQFSKDAFAGKKAVVLIFWDLGCSNCNEAFASLNNYYKQLSNPNDVMIVAVSRDSKLQTPSTLAHVISGQAASNIIDSYRVKTFPSYMVADKGLTIQFSAGNSWLALPIFKDTMTQLLAN